MSLEKLDFGMPLVWKDKSKMDPVAISELKRLKITSDSDITVLLSDQQGVSVRIWREGEGDADMFMPFEEWKRYATRPLMGTPNVTGMPHLSQHASRRFPDQLT